MYDIRASFRDKNRDANIVDLEGSSARNLRITGKPEILARVCARSMVLCEVSPNMQRASVRYESIHASGPPTSCRICNTVRCS
jgi:hypothetical protein